MERCECGNIIDTGGFNGQCSQCRIAQNVNTERNPKASADEPEQVKSLLSDVCHWDDEWCNDDKDDCDAREYETGCKHNFYFNDGDVFSNEFKYCPFCGKQIEVTVRSCDIDYDLDE